nr:dapper homolog 3-like [Pan paniscus]
MVGRQSGQEKLRGRFPPSPVPPSQPRGLFLPGDSQVWPRIPGNAAGEGVASSLLRRWPGARKPVRRGLSLSTAAQTQSGKFCQALSAGASLVILLYRKPGSAGAARSRRERGTPSPRASAGASGGEAGERTPRAARAGRFHAGAGSARAASHAKQKVGEGLPSIGREGSREAPNAHPGVDAAVSCVAWAVDAGDLLATGALPRSRDPPGTPPPPHQSLSFSVCPQVREGAVAGSPSYPARDTAPGGRPCAGNPARSFSKPGRAVRGKALVREVGPELAVCSPVGSARSGGFRVQMISPRAGTPGQDNQPQPSIPRAACGRDAGTPGQQIPSSGSVQPLRPRPWKPRPGRWSGPNLPAPPTRPLGSLRPAQPT